jgi:hypothetical protein
VESELSERIAQLTHRCHCQKKQPPRSADLYREMELLKGIEKAELNVGADTDGMCDSSGTTSSKSTRRSIHDLSYRRTFPVDRFRDGG